MKYGVFGRVGKVTLGLILLIFLIIFIMSSFVIGGYIIFASPNISTVVVNSTNGINLTYENLSIYLSDLDPANSSVAYAWTLNGSSIAFVNLPFDFYNESTVNRSHDFSGNLHHSNVTNASFNSTGGIIGGAYFFDGYNGSIVIKNNETLTFTDSISFEFWINPYVTERKHALSYKPILDLNNDGYTDIILVNSLRTPPLNYNINNTIFWGSSTGFDILDIKGIPGNGTGNIVVGDLDNNGWLDLVLANGYNGTIREVNSTIYWNGPGGIEENNKTGLPTIGATTAGIADLDNDGDLDIVFANRFNSSNIRNINSTIYWNTGYGFDEINFTGLPTSGAVGLAISDFDKNGFLDIVFSNFFNGTTGYINSTLYYNGPSGFNENNFTGLPGYRAISVEAVDINYDNYPDIILGNYLNQTTSGNNIPFRIYENSATGFDENIFSELPGNGSSNFAFADLNYDGYLDLAVSMDRVNGATVSINSTIFWGSVSGFDQDNKIGFPTKSSNDLSVGDVNNDGYLDIMFANTYDGSKFDTNSTLYFGSATGFDETNKQGFNGNYSVSVTFGMSSEVYGNGKGSLPQISTIEFSTNETLIIDFFDDGGKEFNVSVDIRENAWNHVVITIDDARDSIKVYVNGTLVSNVSEYFTLNNFLSYRQLTIGANYLGRNNFNGSIDEVKVYNRTLSAEQVLFNYASGIGNYSQIMSQETMATENWSCTVWPIDTTGLNGSSVSCNILTIKTLFPVWTDNGTNDSQIVRFDNVSFYVNWSDDNGLSSYIFGWNDSGTWENVTNGTLSGYAYNVTVNRSVNAISPSVICWRMYVNDSSDQWNQTDEFCFSVMDAGGSESPSSGGSFGGGTGGGTSPIIDLCENVKCAEISKICIDGSEKKCRPSCIKGSCGTCEPKCQVESCNNIKCNDTTIVCSDGYIVSCENSCSFGSCSKCSPNCNEEIYGIESIIEPLIEEILPEIKEVPCYQVSKKTYLYPIKITDIEIELLIPEGYTKVVNPFSFDCGGDSIDLTLSVPNNVEDVTLLKCSKGNCILQSMKKLDEIDCGSVEFESNKRVNDFLDPIFLPIKINPIKIDINNFRELKSSGVKVEFIGDIFEELDASISTPTIPIKESINKNLKILNVVNIELSKKSKLKIKLSLPFNFTEDISGDSIAIYSKDSDNWNYLGGVLDKKENNIELEIKDISKYLNKDNIAQFSVMGILCNDCVESIFSKKWEPNYETRDAIVFVHGFASNPSRFKNIIDDITTTNQPYKIFTFSYPSSKSVLDNSKSFEESLKLNNGEFDKLYIVAHSLGGLVVQQALIDSYNSKLAYVNKVEKLILVGVPNQGSPEGKTYEDLFQNLMDSDGDLFYINDQTLNDLINGINASKVPNIDYYVLAGTQLYDFQRFYSKTALARLLGIHNKADGIIPIESAQKIGDVVINDTCGNYWEINLTHTNLIKDKVSRTIIEKIISEELYEKGLLIAVGNSQYYKVDINKCSKDDRYVVIGKPLDLNQSFDISGCSCGNGVCGIGEDKFNCPSDCFKFIKLKNVIFPILLGIISFFIVKFVLLRGKSVIMKKKIRKK